LASWVGRFLRIEKPTRGDVWLTRRVPLRRSLPPQRRRPLQPGKAPERRVPVRKKRSRPRRGPERSPEYLAWIRTLPCAVCAKGSAAAIFVEAAHTNAMGGRGLGQKASDFSAIPLCSGHHRENPDSYHVLGEKGFSHRHRINLREILLRLQTRFWHENMAVSRAAFPVHVG
jgi:hypothetical protein